MFFLLYLLKDRKNRLRVRVLLQAEGLHPWKCGEPYTHKPNRQDPWDHCQKLATKSDTDMCSAWKAEVDNLLIFVCQVVIIM